MWEGRRRGVGGGGGVGSELNVLGWTRRCGSGDGLNGAEMHGHKGACGYTSNNTPHTPVSFSANARSQLRGAAHFTDAWGAPGNESH